MSVIKNGRYVDVWGNVEWFKDGEYHRDDGPANELSYGTKMWYLNGKLHREDGPAIEWHTIGSEWWIDGEKITEEEFNQWLAKKQLNEKLHSTLEEKPEVKKVKI